MKKTIAFLTASPEFTIAIAFSLAFAITVIHNAIVFGTCNPH